MTASAAGLRVATLLAGGVAASAAMAWTSRRVSALPEWQRTNFRGRTVTLVGGLSAMLGLLVAAVVIGSVDHPRASTALAIVAAGAGAAGLFDDLRGDASTKGFAGHVRSLLRGRVTSGGAKILVIGAAGLAAAAALDSGWTSVIVEGALIAGAANLANLFDLRPARALKVVLLTAVPLCLAGGPAGVVAAGVTGTAVALLPHDAQERTMLGDAGANALGAATGVAAASALGTAGSGVALLGVLALTAASELVSFSGVIDRVRPLRWLDTLGRRS